MNKQKGATLIVVLILLVALTVIGTLAIRQSIVSLSIATNGQAQQLLTQNSDAAIFQVEDPNRIRGYRSGVGIFGALAKPDSKGKELVFCYRGSQASFFNQNQASVVFEQDGSIVSNSQGTAGYCRVGSQNFFTSNRRAVLTQVSVTHLDAGDANPFQFALRGTDTKYSKMKDAERVVVNAISLVPALSSASDDEINACLSGHVSNSSTAANRITTCLTNLNVPFTTHVAEYTLRQGFV